MSEATQPNKRRRFAPVLIASGVAGAALLSLSLTGTLSGFVASITDSQNTAATGTLVMQQSTTGGSPISCSSIDGGGVSTNTATCSTINEFGGSTALVPGVQVSTATTIENAGTVNANTFTLTPGATCTQSNNGALNGTATDLCAKLNVVITVGGSSVYSGSAAALANKPPMTLAAPVAPGATVNANVSVTLDNSAGAAYQGLAASLPLTWAFAS